MVLASRHCSETGLRIGRRRRGASHAKGLSDAFRALVTPKRCLYAEHGAVAGIKKFKEFSLLPLEFLMNAHPTNSAIVRDARPNRGQSPFRLTWMAFWVPDNWLVERTYSTRVTNRAAGMVRDEYGQPQK